MSDPVIEQIKSKLDIVDVIQNYIKLEKAGINYRAPCPFHSEKSPSFFVSPSRQIWHCFGSCSDGGDIFKFIMKIEGIEFYEALKILAEKAGVTLKKQNPKLQSERKKLESITELACSFFEAQLQESNSGKKAKEYLLKRGIKAKTIKEWRLGYSPEKWTALSDFLIGKGFEREKIVKSGLALKNQNKFYDRFRGRIMFPVLNTRSQVIGFGGRAFKEKETAKYINSPATSLYDKSKVLYGLDKASLEMRKKDYCILTEGYLDTIMSHQAGSDNTVAVSGTALTNFQLNIIKRYTKRLIFAFDMDSAGDSATKKSISSAQAFDFEIKVVLMPEGLDPADIIAKNFKKWFNLLKGAKSIYDFYLESALSKYDKKTIEGKKAIAKEVLPVFKKITNSIEQSHWVKKLSQELEIDPKDALKELDKIPFEKKEEKEKPSNNRKKLLEERILLLFAKNPNFCQSLEEQEITLFSQSESIKLIKEGKIKEEKLNLLFLKAEKEEFSENIEEEFQQCFKQFKIICLKEKLNNLSKEIIKAEKENKETGKLNKEFNKLSQTLSNLYK